MLDRMVSMPGDIVIQGVGLHNIAEIEELGEGRGIQLSRVPAKVRLALNEKAQGRALLGAGSELRFNLEGDEAILTFLHEPLDRSAGFAGPKGVFEVYQGDYQGAYDTTPQLMAEGGETRLVVRRSRKHEQLLRRRYDEGLLTFDPSLLRVMLPNDLQVRLHRIEGAVTPPRRGQAPAGRLLVYGSSITAGGDAVLPSGSYAHAAARRLGTDLINLGFSGSCHVEPAMADYIAARGDWHYAVLELGVNVIDFMPLAEFEQRVRYMLRTIADSSRDRWVFCTDLFTCHRDYDRDPLIAEYRDIVRRTVRSLKQETIVYISGRELLPDDRALTIDLLHPSAEGMQEIARRLARRIRLHAEPQ
ncbi:GDSL-type esterase/lipase family protein [Paenibacillus sambharensis]|uniref:GDSL-type esterase/lipase family protein n=1 Tax=Paenibacillus sambharensis TaxID=1803190 RepID=UPI002482572A|nr:GDSL-type esterase/lipase family protein [Paenibacillus sambharensis]